MKPSENPLPGFEPLFSEIISKIPRKHKRGRGRPPQYNHPQARTLLKRLPFAKTRTIRQQQNYVLAERAETILRKSGSVGFLIPYFLHRSTLLAELGRIESKDWLIRAAEEIAFNGLRGEQALAFIRKIRFGDSSSRSSSWQRYSILSRKVWKAVCQYRHLFPSMTDEQILAELKRVMDWMPSSLKWNARERERKKTASAPPKA